MCLNICLSCLWTAGSLDIWAITVEERAKHDQQFHSLKPISGFITGVWSAPVRSSWAVGNLPCGEVGACDQWAFNQLGLILNLCFGYLFLKFIVIVVCVGVVEKAEDSFVGSGLPCLAMAFSSPAWELRSSGLRCGLLPRALSGPRDYVFKLLLL